MSTIGDIVASLESFAPPALAEDWDNVGLLVGSADWPAMRILTCLTITPATVAEAIEQRVNLIVAHHPLPFHALKTITTATTAGRMLLQLIEARIGVYSPHTAFDSAQTGINQHLAIGLGLQQIEPLVPAAGADEAEIGTGRMGSAGGQLSLMEMVERVKSFLGIDTVRVVGSDEQLVSTVAIACGSGGSLLATAVERGCDCLVTGEITFHGCLEAEARGVGLVLPGHFASERFALLSLADYLGEQHSGIDVWASRNESDPLRSV
jgi:dinuclear metal center YbgI/SA1388 family protein